MTHGSSRLVPKLRLLPVTIFAAALMLTLKIGALWTEVDGFSGAALRVAPLYAQQVEGAAEEAAADPTPADAAAAPPSAADLLGGLTAGRDPAGRADFSRGEIEVLQDLKARREAIEARERELDLREQLLRAAEHTLEAKLEEWKALRIEVEALLQEYDREQDADLSRLAVYYERMKPKDAARIFNELDMAKLLRIVERMNDGRASAIIAQMGTAKATALTSELAARQISVPASN